MPQPRIVGRADKLRTSRLR